jgi:hypothetical protein
MRFRIRCLMVVSPVNDPNALLALRAPMPEAPGSRGINQEFY